MSTELVDNVQINVYIGLASVLLVAVAGILITVRSKARLPVAVAVAVKDATLPTKQEAEPVETGPSKPSIRILYGTQTGTAERFSKQLGSQLKNKYGETTTVDVKDVENYTAETLLHKEKLVIFCMATYGDGEPTDNASAFYTWLLKEAELVEDGSKEAYCEGVAYAVFGLGNKQYEHFNAIGKKVFKSMNTLGGRALIPRGDGDDDGIIDDDFDKWAAMLFDMLDGSEFVGGASASAKSDAGENVSVPAYDVLVLPTLTPLAKPFPAGGSGKDIHRPAWAHIQVVRELQTAQSDRSCVHVEISAAPGDAAASLEYEAGDHVGVFAQNAPAVVADVAARLGYELDAVIKLSKPAGSDSLAPPPPSPINIRNALAYFADVFASPHREALSALAASASKPEEAERLRLLASSTPEGKVAYQEEIGKVHKSLLEVMKAYPSAKPSLGSFFGSVAPRLQPRFYSISSSPNAAVAVAALNAASTSLPAELTALREVCLGGKGSIHVTCSVVRDVMPTGRTHDGVCSTWLQGKRGVNFTTSGELEVPVPVPVFIRHSNFKLPADPETPVIMIGPGTGIAPFRGFLQERAALKLAGVSMGPAHLFFGCRSRAHDFIYERELQAFLAAGVLSHLHLAFSRDGAAKDYVQHHIQRQANELWPLLAKAHVYVCGDAKHMARDVHRALLDVILGGLGEGASEAQAEAFLKEMSEAGRYQRDVW